MLPVLQSISVQVVNFQFQAAAKCKKKFALNDVCLANSYCSNCRMTSLISKLVFTNAIQLSIQKTSTCCPSLS